jgi:hypothetical protein
MVLVRGYKCQCNLPVSKCTHTSRSGCAVRLCDVAVIEIIRGF